MGIGLADMPLTTFTVSELLFHYLRLTCEQPVKEKKGDEDDDDASSVSSVADDIVCKEEMVSSPYFSYFLRPSRTGAPLFMN